MLVVETMVLKLCVCEVSVTQRTWVATTGRGTSCSHRPRFEVSRVSLGGFTVIESRNLPRWSTIVGVTKGMTEIETTVTF